jgi:hypothetical protein
MKTRGMQGLTANRIASETVTLNYSTYEDSGDGSAVVTPVETECAASVGALQAWDIERLEKAGIIIRSGVTIVIPEAPDTQPDTITHGSRNYRVVNWSGKHENETYTVVATCEEITIAGVSEE